MRHTLRKYCAYCVGNVLIKSWISNEDSQVYCRHTGERLVIGTVAVEIKIEALRSPSEAGVHSRR